MKKSTNPATVFGGILPWFFVAATLLGLWASYLQIKSYYANKKKVAATVK